MNESYMKLSFRNLWSMFPYKSWLVLIIFVTQLFQLFIPFITGKLFDSFAVPKTNWNSVCLLGVSLLILEFINPTITYCREILNQKSAAILDRNLSIKYWELIAGLPPHIFLLHPVGVWMEKLSYDIRVIAQSLKIGFVNLVSVTLFLIGTFVLVSLYNWILLLFLLLMFVLGGGCYHLYSSRIKNAAEKCRRGYYLLSDVIHGLLSTLPILLISKRTADYKKMVHRYFWITTERGRRLDKLFSQNHLMLQYLCIGVRVFFLLICVIFVVYEKMTLGSVVALFMLSAQLLAQVSSLISVLPHLSTGFESYQAINNLFKEHCDNVKHNEYISDVNKSSESQIICEDVSFTYDKNASPIINGFNSAFKRNDFCVFIGRNGTGKTSLAKLLLGILRPTSGRIHMAQHLKIGWVEQNSVILRDSILENIRLRDQGISVEVVKDVASICGLDRWISNQPYGLMTLIQPSGISGGQRQMLSIARMLVQNPDILVIDEISNNLDIIMRQKCYEVLNKWCHEKIIILISHDLECISLANRLFFFGKDGVKELQDGFTEDQLLQMLSVEG